MLRYEKSMRTLELPAVLEMLAAEASGEAAKQMCRALRPASMEADVRFRLAQTTAAKDLMVLRGSPSFSGVKDVRAYLQRADLGGILMNRELLEVAAVLHAAASAKRYADGAEECDDSLRQMFSMLSVNRYLEEKITTSIIGDDEIADMASHDLSDIRRKIRVENAKARDALQKYISSPSYAKALQEPIITTRSERYVIPVKADHKNEIPGLIHDVSASGATVFVEPMAVVKANNEIRELRAKEKAEIERILAELSAECASFRSAIDTDFNVLTDLDVIFAKAKLSYRLDCSAPEISDHELFLKRARHPLLAKATAVPIDIGLGGDYDTLVITGPNTGGKTVSLKTLGLLSLMTMCGLHIPVADGSRVPVFSSVLADIGDEQSIEQSLSTFSAHMSNIVEILENCDDGSLLLFDELGAGTDPTEGAALAIAIIERARKSGALVAATTHYAELKIYATTSLGVQNASCEFDVDSLRPTYRLIIGIPGKSNAFAISRRLGLSEDVIADAGRRVNAESVSMETVLEKLDAQRQALEREKAEIDQLRRETEEAKRSADRTRAELSVRLEKADLKTKREAERILEDARRQAEAVFDELDRIRKLEAEEDDHRRVNEARAALRRSLNDAEEALQAECAAPDTPVEPVPDRAVEVGDSVIVRAMGIPAVVLAISPDRTLELQAGRLKLTVKEDEVSLSAKKPDQKKNAPQRQNVELHAESVSPEIDLRGMMTDEAVLVMERYLDSAVMAKQKQVTVIHGKGTGALRQAVHAALKRNRLVKNFRLGTFGEGETGVTVVELK